MTRLPLIAGNWKMHGVPSGVEAYVSGLRIALDPVRDEIGRSVEIVLAPPHPSLDALSRAISGSAIELAAQNVHAAPEGAFTGEVSVSMLEDLGCRYALVGHSERRQIFGETDTQIASKVRRLLESRIDPILCIGETLDEREAQRTLDVLEAQLDAVLEAPDGLEGRLVVAYEPVWAIGTGRTATPEIAQDVHHWIREKLAARLGEAGQQMRILYGGSVKPSNAGELLAGPDVDGALVGGASLEPETFAEIAVSALTASS